MVGRRPISHSLCIDQHVQGRSLQRTAQYGGGTASIGHRQPGSDLRQTSGGGQGRGTQSHDRQRRGAGRLSSALQHRRTGGILPGNGVGAAERLKALRVRADLVQQFVI